MADRPVPSAPRAGSPHHQAPRGVDAGAFPHDPGFSDGLDAHESLRRENAHLRRILGTQPVIEQAKGVLMQRYQIDADRAFHLLSRWSQALELRVSVVSETLLDMARGPGHEASHPAAVEALTQQLGGDWRT